MEQRFNGVKAGLDALEIAFRAKCPHIDFVHHHIFCRGNALERCAKSNGIGVNRNRWHNDNWVNFHLFFATDEPNKTKT